MSIKQKILEAFKGEFTHVDNLIAQHAARPYKTGSGMGSIGPYKIWFRNNQHEINISNISRTDSKGSGQNDPNKKSTGELRKALTHIEKLAKKHGYPAVTVGEVHNHSKHGGFLDKALERYGYEYKKDPYGMDEFNPPSYTKKI